MAFDERAYKSEWAISRHRSLMNEARELLGGKCVVCGTTTRLELDHIDPSTKLFTISLGTQRTPEIFWAEVEKCQLLCRQHHREKTIAEGSATGRNRAKKFQSSGKTPSSIYQGVALDLKNGRWASSIKYKGSRFWLGRFIHELDAAKAYDEKAMELFGERPNGTS